MIPYFDEDEDFVHPAHVRDVFRMHTPPAGLLADLVEFETYYTIRLYRENFDKLTNMVRHSTADWLQKTIQAIEMLIPCYLEVWRRPGVPE